jgi:hypothetical protein
MDIQTPTGEALPMNKQEVVKEDGRTLIYYTFAPQDSVPEVPGENDVEGTHV